MLKELFNAVVEFADEARKPTVLETDRDRPDRYAVVLRDGTIKWEIVTPPRKHRAGSLQDLCAFVCDQVGDDTPTNAAIWYGRDGVVAVLNDRGTRSERVTLPLKLAPQLLTLQELEAKLPRFDQRSFVQLLRIRLAGSFAACPTLIDVVRRVKFTQNVAGGGVVEHTKRSTGQSIESEITGAGTIPEEVVLHVPVFLGTLPASFPVACAIEVDPGTAGFQLIPLPGAVEAAIRAAEARLGEMIGDGVEGKANVYYGAP